MAASHACCYQIARRRGKQWTAIAVAPRILAIACPLLQEDTTYHDLGHDYFEKRDTARLQRRLVSRLEVLGLPVTVEPLPQAA